MSLQSSKSLITLGSKLMGRKCRFPLSPNKFCVATLTSKELIDPNYKKVAPFPYETKNFNHWYWATDSTLKRFNDNTKIIVVDGNIGAGKTSLAKELAEVFDMKYIPEPDVSAYFITPYGYDIRELNDILPESYKGCDVNTFYEDPYNRNVTAFQFRMLALRYLNYIDAFEHLLHTGQGIVFDRCVFADVAFMEAMFRAGYIREEAREAYLFLYKSVTEHLFKPHLNIYLDVPVPTILERIKQRNRPSEVNSKVLTPQYLTDIANAQKQLYFKTLEKFCEFVVYDWSEFGDIEVIVDDLEKIDFDNYGKFDPKLQRWREMRDNDFEWGRLRRLYTAYKGKLLSYLQVYNGGVDEVTHSPADQLAFDEIMKKVPGNRYTWGFNKDMGDSYFFKTYGSKIKDKIFVFPTLWYKGG